MHEVNQEHKMHEVNQKHKIHKMQKQKGRFARRQTDATLQPELVASIDRFDRLWLDDGSLVREDMFGIVRCSGRL